MSSSDDPANASLGALRGAISRLAPLVPRPASDDGGASPPATALDASIAGLHEWLVALTEHNGRPPGVDSILPASLREKHLSFTVPRGAETGEEHSQGEKVVAVLDTVRELVVWIFDRLLDDGADPGTTRDWGRLLVALLLGIERHLGSNDFGEERTDQQVLAYRTLFARHLFKPMLQVVFPNANAVPSASGQEVDATRSTAVPRDAKYVALAVLATALSKHRENKAFLRELLPADYLAAIFQSGADAHLSQLALEIAFRIAPPAPRRKAQAGASAAAPTRSPERHRFIYELFPPRRFGSSAKQWQQLFDQLSVNEWHEKTHELLARIAEGHIKRSQPFRVLAFDYDGRPLLDLPVDSQPPSLAAPEKPSPRQLVDNFYEPATLWICRHILAISLHEPDEVLEQRKQERAALGLESRPVTESDVQTLESEKERAVVELRAVRALHVEDVEPEPDLIRVTVLLDAASPLTIGSRPHPALPIHIGTALQSATDSQASSLGLLHKLVFVLPGEGNNLGVLKKVLEERSSIYTKLGSVLVRFPVRSAPIPAEPPRKTATASPGKSLVLAPAPTVALGRAAAGSARAVGTENGDNVARAAGAVERAARKSSQAGPVIAEVAHPAAGPHSTSIPAQVETLSTRNLEPDPERRREEVARLAQLDSASSPNKGDELRDSGRSVHGSVNGNGRDENAPATDVAAGAVSRKGIEDGKTGAFVTAQLVPRVPSGAPTVAGPAVSDISNLGAHSLIVEAGPPTFVDGATAKRVGNGGTIVERPAASVGRTRVAQGPPDELAPPGTVNPRMLVKPVVHQSSSSPADITAPGPATKPQSTDASASDDEAQATEQPPAQVRKRRLAPSGAARRYEKREKREDQSKPPAAPVELDPGTRTRRKAATEAAAKLQGSKKRGRTDEEDEEETTDTEEHHAADSPGSSDAPQIQRRKIIKKTAATAEPASKRRKKAAVPISPLTSESSTDYELERAHPAAAASLKRPRRAEGSAAGYGRTPKVVLAAERDQLATAGASARRASSPPAKTRKSRPPVKTATETAGRKHIRAEYKPTAKTKRVKQAGGQAAGSSRASDVLPRKKHDKRVSDDIPPPRELSPGELERVHELEQPREPRSRESARKDKPVRSFSELVARDGDRSPSDEVMAEGQPLHGAESELSESEQGVGFEHGLHSDNVQDVSADDDRGATSPKARDFAASTPEKVRASSPSPLLDPAEDETFVERAVPGTAVARVAPIARPVQGSSLQPVARVATPQGAPRQYPAQADQLVVRPILREQPAAPQGADDSGVYLSPYRSAEKATKAQIAPPSTTTRRITPGSALVQGSSAPAVQAPADVFGGGSGAEPRQSVGRAPAPAGLLDFSSTSDPRPSRAGPSGLDRSRGATAPVNAQGGSLPRAGVRRGVEAGTQVGASLETAPAQPQREPLQQTQQLRQPLPGGSRVRLGPGQPGRGVPTGRQSQHELAKGLPVRPTLEGQRRLVPPLALRGAEDTGEGESREQASLKRSSPEPRRPDQRRVRDTGASGPVTSTPGGPAEESAKPGPRTEKPGPPQHSDNTGAWPPLQELPYVDNDANEWASEDERLFSWVEEFARVLVERQREQRIARRTIEREGVRRHYAALSQHLATLHGELIEMGKHIRARVEEIEGSAAATAFGDLEQMAADSQRVWDDVQGFIQRMRG